MEYASNAHDMGVGTMMTSLGNPLTFGITLTGRF